MIVGPGWAFLGLVAVGLATLVLTSGCSVLVVADLAFKAPSDRVPFEEVREGLCVR